MREAEAKKKFCPHVMVGSMTAIQTLTYTVNELSKLGEEKQALAAADSIKELDTLCKGSECMMWCWTKEDRWGNFTEGTCGLTK